MSDIPSSNKKDDKDFFFQENSLPFYMNLYPPLEVSEPESGSTKLLNLSEEDKNKPGKNNEALNLTTEFLEKLTKNPNTIPKAQINEIVFKALKISKLIEKMDDNNKANKKMSEEDLSNACAQKFIFKKILKGEIIFKIGDEGDKFYYILKGKINILKIREVSNVYMSTIEYIKNFIFLIKVGENYLFQEVIRKNNHILNITSDEEIFILFRIWFKIQLILEVNQQTISDQQTLEDFFKLYEQELEDYNLEIKELEILDLDIKNRVPLSFINWKNYIIKKCELSARELVFYEQFKKVLLDEKKKKIICLIYESFEFLGPTAYFGDTALDSELNKRNETIRAEEDTYLACLKNNDYLNIIAPKRRFEKAKTIAFLFNTFFFQQINPHIFERNYYHLFYLKKYKKNSVLFDYGMVPKKLLFVKEGHISLDLKISVLDMHKLIKFIYTNVLNNNYFKDLSKNRKNEILPKEVMREINRYIHEPKLDRLNMQNFEFIKEMKRVQNFRMTILMGVETIGLEEVFLKIPYFMKGIVVKDIVCYELEVTDINLMLKEEKQIRYNYVYKSIKKILSLLERLQGIKKNCVDMAASKYNIKNDSLYDKVFSSTQFPIIKNSSSENNILPYNQSDKNKDNYKRKLTVDEEIDYKENIKNLMNKANSIMQKSPIKEKEEENSFDKNKIKDRQMLLDKEQVTKENNTDNNNYKTIQLFNFKRNSRNNIITFRTPITNFMIKTNQEDKNNLLSRNNIKKLKNLKITSNFSKIKKRNNYFSTSKNNYVDANDSTNENIDVIKLKPKLYTGIKTNNLFLLGDNKYYTIKQLRQQVHDFNPIDKNLKRLKIIQSNEINNNYNERDLVDMNNPEINNNRRDIKKRLIKFSQCFHNYHLSFVPLSVKYNDKLLNENNDNSINRSLNYSKMTRNSSYTENFLKNKKNFIFITKRNKIKKIKRIKSDLTKVNKELPKLRNMLFGVKINNITDKI